MSILVPLISLIGPIYFAIRGLPLEFVLAWAAVWTSLRFLSVWRQALAVLNQNDDEPPSWLDRYPSVTLVGAFVATLAMFEATHVVVYWTICRLIQNSN